MPRPPRYCPPGIPQHIIQRGNNRQPCFFGKLDFAYYLNCLADAARQNGVAIHALILMTNHVHLLATPLTPTSISLMMQDLGRRYVMYINRLYQRTGTLLEGRFKACLIECENYLLRCYRYIELNPVRAGMVEHPADYLWSSYGCNALGKQSDILTPHPQYLALGATPQERTAAYRQLFADTLSPELLQDIRKALHSGLALGSEHFKDEMEMLTGRSLYPVKRGRRPIM